MEIKTMGIFQIIVTFIGFIATIIAIITTNKRQKSNKYIETITTERIKWLEIIRNDTSELTSLIYHVLNLLNKESERTMYENMDSNEQDEKNREKYQNNFNTVQISNFLINSEFSINKYLIIKKLCLFKLKLNPKEDFKIIELIEYFILFFNENENKSYKDLEIAKNNIELFIEKVQILLKNEWEKVKKESKGKY